MKLINTLFDTAKIKEAYAAMKDIFAPTNKSLNDDLAGIVGNNFITLSSNKVSGYDSHYCIYRGIDMLAESIAQLPLQIYRGDTLMNPDFTLQQGFNLNRPHPQVSLNELIYQCCVYFWYRGEFMTYIDLEHPFSLEPVNPRLMVKQKNGTWKWNNKMIIPEEQLIYVPLFNPDGDRGLSPVDVVKAELINDTKAGEYNTKFFENFAQIGGTLTDPKGQATTDQMRDAVRQFNQKHASSGSAYKTAGLTGGITFNETAQTMREMEFLESRREVRDKILAVLGIHKALFGVTDQVNRSVSEEATRQLWLQVLKPKAIRIQEKLNQQLFNRYFPGYKCKFDFNSIDALKEGAEAKLTQAKVYRELGYTMNEINEHFDLGMEDVTEPVGDMRFIPTSFIPVDDLYIETSIPTKSSSDTLDKVVDIVLKEEKSTNKSKATRTYIRRYNKLQRTVEKKVSGKIGKYFAKQLGKVISIIKTNPTTDTNTLLSTIHNLINEEKTVLSDTMRPVYRDGSQEAVGFALTAIKADKVVTRDDYVDEVVEAMVNKISNINNYTYKLIRSQVKESTLEGESLNQLSKRITSIYKFNSSRVRTIARTESGMLISRTTDKVYKENNVKNKRWGGNLDEATRDTHATNQGMGEVDYNYVYPNTQVFPLDGNGGAANNVSCRCCLIPVVAE